MSNYLERYVAGDHVDVWRDLVAVGAAIRDEPLYGEAMSVARETVRRAHYNIDLLNERLNTLGFKFGYDWWDADSRDILEYNPPPPVFLHPRPDILLRLTELEARIGYLPLSLRAWYEQIGAVNFVGVFPVPDPADPDGLTCYEQWVRAGGRNAPTARAGEPFAHDLDPLFVDSLASVEASVERFLTSPSLRTKVSATSDTYELALAPDEWLKYGVSGGGSYVIRIPCSAADANLEYEWHETTFVDYLRICFRWGGFPGLALKRVRPEKELAFLTHDLLPL